jgi:rubrerythrin
LLKLNESLKNAYINQLNWQTLLEEFFKSIEIDTTDSEVSWSDILESVRVKIANHEKKIEDLLVEISSLNEKIVQQNNEQIETLKNEYTEKLSSYEIKMKEDHSKLIEDLKKEHDEFLTLIKADFDQQILLLNKVFNYFCLIIYFFTDNK